ncbi:MAG: putative metalloprotease CJM1_0395 family protein [Opitutales bacterium]
MAARDREKANRDRGGHVNQLPTKSPERLSDEERKELRVLRERDQKVRAEQLAEAVRSGLSAQVQFTYKLGPDGNRYAIDGHVKHSVAPGSTPEQTIERARELRAAILSSGQSSPQDLRTVAEVDHIEAQARAQIRESEAPASEAVEEAAAAEEPSLTVEPLVKGHPGPSRYLEATEREASASRALDGRA